MNYEADQHPEELLEAEYHEAVLKHMDLHNKATKVLESLGMTEEEKAEKEVIWAAIQRELADRAEMPLRAQLALEKAEEGRTCSCRGECLQGSDGYTPAADVACALELANREQEGAPVYPENGKDDPFAFGIPTRQVVAGRDA